MDKNYNQKPKVDSNDAHPVATGVGAAGAATGAVVGQKVAEKVNPKQAVVDWLEDVDPIPVGTRPRARRVADAGALLVLSRSTRFT